MIRVFFSLNSGFFLLFDSVWSFKLASIRDIKEVTVVPLIICPRNFSWVTKKCDLSEDAFMFSFNKIL